MYRHDIHHLLFLSTNAVLENIVKILYKTLIFLLIILFYTGITALTAKSYNVLNKKQYNMSGF